MSEFQFVDFFASLADIIDSNGNIIDEVLNIVLFSNKFSLLNDIDIDSWKTILDNISPEIMLKIVKHDQFSNEKFLTTLNRLYHHLLKIDPAVLAVIFENCSKIQHLILDLAIPLVLCDNSPLLINAIYVNPYIDIDLIHKTLVHRIEEQSDVCDTANLRQSLICVMNRS